MNLTLTVAINRIFELLYYFVNIRDSSSTNQHMIKCPVDWNASEVTPIFNANLNTRFINQGLFEVLLSTNIHSSVDGAYQDHAAALLEINLPNLHKLELNIFKYLQ